MDERRDFFFLGEFRTVKYHPYDVNWQIPQDFPGAAFGNEHTPYTYTEEEAKEILNKASLFLSPGL